MTSIDDIVRQNPEALREMEAFQGVLESLHRLREAGVTRPEEFNPLAGRLTLKQRKDRPGTKVSPRPSYRS